MSMMGDDAREGGVLAHPGRSLASFIKRERHRGFYSDAAGWPRRPFKSPPRHDGRERGILRIPEGTSPVRQSRDLLAVDRNDGNPSGPGARCTHPFRPS